MPGGKARGQEGSAWWAHPAAPARTADTHTAEEGLRDQYLWVYVQWTSITLSVLCIKNLIFLSPMDKSTGKSMGKIISLGFRCCEACTRIAIHNIDF